MSLDTGNIIMQVEKAEHINQLTHSVQRLLSRFVHQYLLAIDGHIPLEDVRECYTRAIDVFGAAHKAGDDTAHILRSIHRMYILCEKEIEELDIK